MATPTVIVVRPVDDENSISVFGVNAQIVDVDLGRLDLTSEDAWNEWWALHTLNVKGLYNPEARRWLKRVMNRTAVQFGWPDRMEDDEQS